MFQRNWKQLIKPRRIDFDTRSATSDYGKFVAEPLERGFGTTLGNALRRVLLSSLQGGAITKKTSLSGRASPRATLPSSVTPTPAAATRSWTSSTRWGRVSTRLSPRECDRRASAADW